MFEKVLTNGVAVSYGPSFPTSQVADGTLFYKTVASTGFPVGFYVFGTRPDTNTTTIGPQVGQTWFPADAGDMYLKLTGGTLTGALALVSHVKVSQSTSAARFTFGNTSSVTPIILESQNKVLKIGLGQSFSGSGGTLTSVLSADFTNLNTGFKWNNNTVWHAGNDGQNSGLDADKLDGAHANKLSVINTIPVRDAFGDIFINRVNIASVDDEEVGRFVVTNGTDGYTKVVPVARAKESIRTSTYADGTNRKTWNINITGNAGSASEVHWNNVTNKPTWLEDGTIHWDDISGKPTMVEKFHFDETFTYSKTAKEFTANQTKDVFSGLWFGERVKDAPTNDNTYADPGGVNPWNGNDRQHYWAGFQTFNGTTSASSGVQLIANWDTEDFDPNGDGNSPEDARSYLVYRVNDENGVRNAAYNGYSPWIKIWTNTSLRSLSQLENNVGFVTGTDLQGYLKLIHPTEQQVEGQVAFKNNYVYGRKSNDSVSYILNATTGDIEAKGKLIATSHFETTSGDHYTANGRVWSDNGSVGAGSAGGLGSVLLLPGYRSGTTNFTGVLRFSNSSTGISFGRIMGDMTGGFMRYDIDPDASFGGNANKYHRFDATIKSTGDVVAYASDARLKKNVSKINSAISKIQQLGGYTYDWDLEKCQAVGFAPSNPHEHGLIAQEVQQVIPDAVCESAIDGYLTVKYERIVPLLTAAVSEQQSEIEQLRSEVAELKAMVAALMQR
jgi:Chaperone of endosialidase